jgi:hypothetical protein
MAEIQNDSNESKVDYNEEEQILNEIKDEIIEKEQQTSVTSEPVEIEIVKLTVVRIHSQ